ncbi:secretory calcium-binding phosphoprotein 1 [Pempheris klunzingeri]|uniref:secretory calcium-binding phosphoprotein 1 n=1 Tax=Pempheris klunzingeri TaxID=3127111 RepID=UPI003981038D
MKAVMIIFCLIGVVFANPISYNFGLESSELDPNTTESLSVSQSSENDTSEVQSSEENISNQSQSSESESDSLESSSEDKTSEESNSQSDEHDETNSMAETRDDSMGSEENVRKSWVRVFASVTKVMSAEDNSSTEVEGQSDHLTEKQPEDVLGSNTAQGHKNLPLVESPTDSSDTTSDSADTSDTTGVPAVTSDSSESNSSESNETSETSDSSDASKSSEESNESNQSESSELQQIKTQDCVNGTQSCESDEYFFQDIGDDAHYSVDNLMVPDEDERELSLRR